MHNAAGRTKKAAAAAHVKGIHLHIYFMGSAATQNIPQLPFFEDPYVLTFVRRICKAP